MTKILEAHSYDEEFNAPWSIASLGKGLNAHGVCKVCVKGSLREQAFEDHVAFLLRVVVPCTFGGSKDCREDPNPSLSF